MDILRELDSYQELLPLILHHHEFYDGRGYPDGTKGDEISLDTDSNPRAAYFDQVQNGVYIRMAIILALLGIPDR